MRLLLFFSLGLIISSCNPKSSTEQKCDLYADKLISFLDIIDSKSDSRIVQCLNKGHLDISLFYDNEEDNHVISEECFQVLRFIKVKNIKNFSVYIVNSEDVSFLAGKNTLKKHENSVKLVNKLLYKIQTDTSSLKIYFDEQSVSMKNIKRMLTAHGTIYKARYIRSYLMQGTLNNDLVGEIHLVCINDKHLYQLNLKYGDKSKVESFDLIGNNCEDSVNIQRVYRNQFLF